MQEYDHDYAEAAQREAEKQQYFDQKRHEAEIESAATPGCIHIGDGVYASFDGYHILLRINDHRNEPAVFLEPAVMESLINFYNKYAKPDNTQAKK